MKYTDEQIRADWAEVPLDDAAAVLRKGHELYPDTVLASSFGLEDVALIYLTSQQGIRPRVISLDTGRLPEETYQCAEDLRERTGAEIQWMFPERKAVEELERKKGLYSFRESVENRLECCGIRKVEPLGRALEGRDAWVTGQRREQSVTRRTLNTVEIDDRHGGIVKLNPLASWTLTRVWDYVKTEKIPYNVLHDRGYPSIGCAPCTRAVKPGEDQRAGRWWWEQPEHKECGLHIKMVDGKPVALRDS